MAEHLPDGESRNLRIIAERIRSRRTTNLFLKQKVSKQLLHDAIELARWAPNHHLTEPWHFYLLGDEKKAACADLIRTIVTENKTAEMGEHKFKAAKAHSRAGLWSPVKNRMMNCVAARTMPAVVAPIQNILLYLSEAGCRFQMDDRPDYPRPAFFRSTWNRQRYRNS